MQASQLTTGIAIQQETQGDLGTYVPDGSLNVEKFSPTAILAISGFTAIVGPTLSAAVQYTSLQAAINAVPAGSSILVMPGTYVENVTVNKNVQIMGRGYGSNISGTFTVSTNYSSCFGFRFTGALLFNVGSVGNFMNFCWQATGQTITDSGTSNMYSVVQE